MQRKERIAVIGAGIQGVCTGLQLIKKGIPVTIFDRQDPLSPEYKPLEYLILLSQQIYTYNFPLQNYN